MNRRAGCVLAAARRASGASGGAARASSTSRRRARGRRAEGPSRPRPLGRRSTTPLGRRSSLADAPSRPSAAGSPAAVARDGAAAPVAQEPKPGRSPMRRILVLVVIALAISGGHRGDPAPVSDPPARAASNGSACSVRRRDGRAHTRRPADAVPAVHARGQRSQVVEFAVPDGTAGTRDDHERRGGPVLRVDRRRRGRTAGAARERRRHVRRDPAVRPGRSRRSGSPSSRTGSGRSRSSRSPTPGRGTGSAACPEGPRTSSSSSRRRRPRLAVDVVHDGDSDFGVSTYSTSGKVHLISGPGRTGPWSSCPPGHR